MLHEDYIIRIAESNETSAILSFLHEHHRQEDIITFGFFKQNEHRITAEEERYMDDEYRDFVANNPCLVAVHRDRQEIVGVVILHDYSLQHLSKSKIIQNLNDSMLQIDKSVGLDQLCKKMRTVKFRSLAVHADHRGRGLAKALMKEGIELCRKYNYELVFSFFTLPAAKKAAAAVGFKVVGTSDLTTICNEKGSCLFADMSPYNVTTVMALELW